jgi:hypothetical protein
MAQYAGNGWLRTKSGPEQAIGKVCLDRRIMGKGGGERCFANAGQPIYTSNNWELPIAEPSLKRGE